MRAREYERGIGSLTTFLEAFSNLVDNLEPVDSFGLSRFPTWRPKPGREALANQQVAKVAALSGAAAMAFDQAGVAIDYKRPGTWATERVNPALVWSTIMDAEPMADPRLVAMVGYQALGLLREMLAQQTDRERVLRGPWRGSSGCPHKCVRRRAFPHGLREVIFVAGVVASLQALLVTVMGGVLVFPVAAHFGWGS